ncbi:MAG: pyridoxal-phosphate dependent enzyme [Blastocatellia bacterium]|nr:pyridoxal-phosphate dependent enzyme [Blastocatellia bacterium]
MLTLSEAVRPVTFIESVKLREHLGLDVVVATETFQHTGSFKFRAAYNLASNVPNDEILSASSGNFGQALAYACRLVGKRCTVVMPETSAKVKIDAVRDFGATVDLIDTNVIGRNERVAQLAAEMPDAYFASAYDNEYVIAGNATLGDELATGDFDAVVTPVGGGGLISGLATGLRRSGSNAEMYGAEPELANDASRSFKVGSIIPNEVEPMTIADGARTISLGNLNWPIIREHVSGFIEVPEADIRNAVKLFFSLVNLKSEPTGALSLAAVAADTDKWKGKRLCVVVSGGNVDPGIYKDLIG